ncbi:MAG: 4-phosphoerythronate dehydrogenase [Rikenellaceae bacterium]|nr:4-phosphoerythronate dehydrogenase [Rikenellaceae bacterium]
MKIVIDCDIPYILGVWEPYAEVAYLPGDQISAEHVHDADALIVRTRTRCNQALLEGSSVRVISTATIGTDHIDLEWCAANGIRVESAAGCNARGVLQWVSAALVGVCRKRDWQPDELTLGVVGVGHVGSLVAEYAASWGFRVLRCDPPRSRREGPDGFCTLQELLPQCDILTLHVPFTRAGSYPTEGLIDASALNLLPQHAVVFNSSRGGVVDEHALLESGHDFALDTWQGEPNLNPEVLQRAIFATPHIAGYSRQGKATATSMACQAVARALGVTIEIPSPIPPTTPRPISWEELQGDITRHFDISAESTVLKTHPEQFEQLRNNYAYRQEFF